MILFRNLALPLALFIPVALFAQDKKRLPDVSMTIKANLVLPVPLGNPLFGDITETVGQLDGVYQYPVYKGLSLGLGGKMTWFGIKERALAPDITTGEVRRSTFYGKLAYEQYTGSRTFYELHGRLGMSVYTFDCPTCPDQGNGGVLHWGVGASYYIHATDNLAFGLMLGYETDATRFSASDLGLGSFPGRRELGEVRDFQNLVFGMGFSTRLRRSPEGPGGW